MSTITTTGRRNGRPARQAALQHSVLAEVKPEVIRKRAYEIFLARKGEAGDHLSDWAQAERELCGDSQDEPVAVRSGDRHGREAPFEAASQPIRDGILDNR
ncbi:MAG: DUF2934 domain-containing protein [Vicinamibacterales bacterium]